MDRHFDAAAEVLIVGAGPTGLTLALALRQRGAACRIIDRAEEATMQSRAIAIHARTLEVFAAMSVADDILAGGVRVRAFAYDAGGRERVRLTIGGLEAETPFPFVHCLPQNETERVLTAHLVAAGGRVERGVALTALVQDTDGVRATLTHANGTTETVQTRYLIGCDGAHSAVRHALGVPFVGEPYADTYWLADVRIAGGVAPATMYALLGTGEFAAVVPMDAHDRYRIVARVAVEQQGEGDAPTLAAVQAAMDRLAPTPVRLHDPIWLAAFRLHHRKVTRYRVGRVFLAGDAAHIHSPAGGQGMNTGIQDAANLAWKLDFALRGTATPALLESYHTERDAVATEVLRNSDRTFRLMMAGNPVVRWLRNAALTALLPLPVAKRALLRSQAEIGIRYAAGAAVAKDPGGAGVKTGLRAPDAALIGPDGEQTGLHTLLAAEPGRYTLLLFAGIAGTPAGAAALARLAARVGERYGDFVTPVWIAANGDVLPTGETTDRYSDSNGAAHRTYGAKGATAYLVRPDGYIAARGGAMDARMATMLLAHLGGVFLPAAQATAQPAPAASGTLVA